MVKAKFVTFGIRVVANYNLIGGDACSHAFHFSGPDPLLHGKRPNVSEPHPRC